MMNLYHQKVGFVCKILLIITFLGAGEPRKVLYVYRNKQNRPLYGTLPPTLNSPSNIQVFFLPPTHHCAFCLEYKKQCKFKPV